MEENVDQNGIKKKKREQNKREDREDNGVQYRVEEKKMKYRREENQHRIK